MAVHWRGLGILGVVVTLIVPHRPPLSPVVSHLSHSVAVTSTRLHIRPGLLKPPVRGPQLDACCL